MFSIGVLATERADLRDAHGIKIPHAKSPTQAWGDMGLLLTEDDSAASQIVGGKFHFHPISGEDADEMLAHLP